MLQAISTCKANDRTVNVIKMRVTKAGLVFTSDYLFPGLLIWSCGANIVNTPMNQSVIFIKEADVVPKNKFWKVAVSF
jgi:hypothetical protein